MKIYDFQVLLEPDDEAGGYVVTCPVLPGCYTQGDTIDEAIENIKEAILLCLEDLQSQQLPANDVSNAFQPDEDFWAQWDALGREIDDQWKSDKTAVELVAEQRR